MIDYHHQPGASESVEGWGSSFFRKFKKQHKRWGSSFWASNKREASAFADNNKRSKNYFSFTAGVVSKKNFITGKGGGRGPGPAADGNGGGFGPGGDIPKNDPGPGTHDDPVTTAPKNLANTLSGTVSTLIPEESGGLPWLLIAGGGLAAWFFLKKK